KAQAPRLMRNLLAYAEAVKAGRAGPVEVYVQKKTGYEGPIAGRVFNDLNDNGRYDDGEPGIAGVGVSDRTAIVTTNADGTYTVPNTAGDAEFVYISLPAGYSKWGKWYQRLAGAKPGEKFDFPLKAADERQPFTFAQVSDIHVGGSGTRELLAAGLAEIAAVKEGVAFVLATGDLVNVGSITKQYDDYVAGVATSKVPYFSVIGNHDTNDRGSANYRKYLGPDYYSFDYADCHFLIINSMHKTPQQRAWIEQDLKLLRGRKRLFMFQHFAPSEEEHKLFASYGTEGVFTGHWHSQRTVKVGQMGSYNHPNFLFGGIDCSPAAFKLIRVEPEGIRTRMRYMADGKRLTIVTPNEALMIPQGDLLVVVDAYETAAEYVSMRFELKSGQTLVAEGELARQGDWNWRGAVPAGKIARGAYDLSVTATNDRGEQSTARSSFMVMAVKPAPAAAQTARSDWPQFGGGPQRGGVSDSGLEPPLAPVWYRHTGANFDAASPVLKDGTVYVGMKDRGDFDRNGVLALRAEDGEQLWFTPTPAAVSHSVAVDDRRVYACSHGGIVHAFDRAGGKPLWQQVLGSPVDRWQYAGPVVLGGTVFAGTYAYFGAFNAADGAPKWHKTFGPDWISSYSCPAAQGDVVVVAGNSQGKTPRAVRADTGEPVWEYATDERLHGSPVIADGRVIFTTYGGILHCADLATGRQRWKQPLEGGRSLSTPAVHNGVIVTGGTGSIRAYKLQDGAPLWSVPIGKSALKMAPYNNGYDALVGSPTIAGGIAYVPCGDGKLYALALENGKMIWCMDFGSPLVSAPCISGDRLYLTTFDGGVYCLAGRKSFAPATN
ncbi:MAG: PQQ-binding-like beta-propeller repeat protein, partial [Phycisphaerae bacterium]